MDAAYYHLLLNHLPILGTLFGVLLLLAAVIANNKDWARAAFFTLVVAAVFTAPVFSTGEGSEEFVEELPGTSRRILHEHEEAAVWAEIFSYVLGALSLGMLILGKRFEQRQRMVWAFLVLLGLQATATMMRTGQLGGQIRRPELRGESVQTPPNPSSEEHKDAEHKDD